MKGVVPTTCGAGTCFLPSDSFTHPPPHPFKYGFFRKEHRKTMSSKDLARQADFPILTVEHPQEGRETCHASPRPLVPLDQGTCDDLPWLAQATTQGPGQMVLRLAPGALWSFGQLRPLPGRLVGSARTLGPLSPARVVSARRDQVRQPASGLGRHYLLRPSAALAVPRLAPATSGVGPGRLHSG